MSAQLNKQEPRHTAWRGYTLDELRYRRALVAIKLDIEKERLAGAYQSTFNNSMALNGRGGNGIIGKLNTAMSFFEYGSLAYGMVKKMINIYKNFKN